jgi:hypothetical protein
MKGRRLPNLKRTAGSDQEPQNKRPWPAILIGYTSKNVQFGE